MKRISAPNSHIPTAFLFHFHEVIQTHLELVSREYIDREKSVDVAFAICISMFLFNKLTDILDFPVIFFLYSHMFEHF